jgi:hypothetical protein
METTTNTPANIISSTSEILERRTSGDELLANTSHTSRCDFFNPRAWIFVDGVAVCRVTDVSPWSCTA